MIPKSNSFLALETTVFFSALVISFSRALAFLLIFIFHLFNNAKAPIAKAPYNNKSSFPGKPGRSRPKKVPSS